ncbi:MAG: right-handed parallel beta-helix repeat-containing protein [Candidatus Thorarchaeota archaeon]|nr:right-handed parallel beta-helix repeat-containing protein [Candidatus Thorarchaeota archaeon]
MNLMRYRQGLLLFAAMALVLMITPITMREGVIQAFSGPVAKDYSVAYQVHAPITITSNSEFASQASLEGWEGAGTTFEPYIIEGYSITTTYSCIEIFDVSAHFIIRDCYLETLWGGLNYGMHIESSSHGSIENCVITNAGTGIFIKDSSDIQVENCEIYHHMEYGINFESSDFCDIYENNIHDNLEGIFAQFADDSLIRSNMLHDNYHSSIDLYDAMKIVVINNTGDLSDIPFLIESSQNCTISRNTAYDGGVYGFQLTQSMFCTLTDNTAFDSDTGFLFENANYCELRDNNSQNNTGAGFTFYGSDEILVEDNYAFNNEFGYELASSWNATFLRNSAVNNTEYGFLFENTDNPSVRENIAYYNDPGFVFSDARNCVVTGNIARNNSGNGFTFGGAEITSGSIVRKNVAIYNLGYGFRFNNQSSNNVVFRNVIGWNEMGNAIDNGEGNSFDDQISKGNAWSDYSGSGTYLVSGDAASVDHYPHTANLAAPTITPLNDIEIASDTPNQWLNWSVASGLPKSYEIFRNGILVSSGEWDESWIALALTGLQEGEYNFTLRVVDLLGNEVTSTVMVTVVERTNGFDPQVILMIGGGVAVVLVIVFIVMRRRNY